MNGTWTSLLKGTLAIAAMSVVFACATAPRASNESNSSDRTATIQRLQAAETFDRDSSSAFTRSAPSLDHYYARKADEVHDIIRRLQAGQEVPEDDIQHALDNSLASTFGVPAY